MKIFSGPVIKAANIEEARYWCEMNGLGYCEVVGMLIGDVFRDDPLQLNQEQLN